MVLLYKSCSDCQNCIAMLFPVNNCRERLNNGLVEEDEKQGAYHEIVR